MDNQPIVPLLVPPLVSPVIAAAIVAIQAELIPMTKSADNESYSSKYVPLDKVTSYAILLLQAHKIAVMQPPVTDSEGHAALETILVHESGVSFSRITKLAMNKVDPQAHGSAITYQRRYSLMGILGITAEDEDDDGNTAADRQAPASDEQITDLKSMLVHLKIPSDQMAKIMWTARFKDTAALQIINYRKMVSEKVVDLTAATEARKIEVSGTSDIEDESTPFATLMARLHALKLTAEGEKKFVFTVTEKPLFKLRKDQKPEDLTAFDNGLKSYESGVRNPPADWVKSTKENVIVDAEISDPQK